MVKIMVLYSSILRPEATHAGVAELADARDLKSRGSDPVPVRPRSPAPYRGVEQLVARRAHNPEVAGSSPVPATMSSVHNATEHSYVKEQSKGCSFAISTGRSAPVERLSGRSVFFTRPCQQDTQSPHPGGCPAPRSPGIPLPPASPGRR